LLALVGANLAATQGADIKKRSLEESCKAHGSTSSAENGQLFDVSNHESQNTNQLNRDTSRKVTLFSFTNL
jgi:hypothetical protein